MTITVAEQGAATAEAGAAEASEGAKRATRTGGRTQQDRPRRRERVPTEGEATAARVAFRSGVREGQRRAGGRTQQGSQPRRTGGRTQQGTQGGREVTPGPVGRQGGSQRRGGTTPRPRLTIDKSGGTSYQAVVLAEFVAAILLVAATPFAKKESPGISPYAGSDLLQLVAITLVYFVLALISGASRGAGRFAAWFGALILLTVGLAEAARLAKLLNVFHLQSPPAQNLGNQSGGQP